MDVVKMIYSILSRNMPTILFYGSLYAFSTIFMILRDVKRIPLNIRFILNFMYKLFLYFGEILTMFAFFRVIVLLFNGFFEYDEIGILKKFIDFFTVYQIFLFVVLNLYDSLKKEIYISLLHQIESVQSKLDANETVGIEIIVMTRLHYYERYFKYDDIDISENKDFNSLVTYLKEYENNRIEDAQLANDAKYKINLLKIELNNKKERMDSLWNLSLVLRYHAARNLKNKSI